MRVLSKLRPNRRSLLVLFLATLGVTSGALLSAQSQTAHATTFDIRNVSIRLGQTYVLRGPDSFDSPLSQYKDLNGTWHSFYEKSGADPYGGWTRSVTSSTQDAISSPESLNPAIPKTDCGNWMFNTQKVGSNLVALVHHEDNCDYSINQTNKSMTLAVSTDNGATWNSWGKIISSPIGPKAGNVTGDGDCQFIDGHDNYLYSYCLQTWQNDGAGETNIWRTIVARAPSWSIGPGSWYKYNWGAWGSAGLSGGATALPGLSGGGSKAAGYWVPQGKTMLIGGDQGDGGVRLFLSDDKVNFTKLAEPLIPYSGNEEIWGPRTATTPTPLLSYFSMANNANGNAGSPLDGSNNVGDQFNLWYRYSPPGSNQQYYVKQIVYISYQASPPPFQVGNVLTRWADPGTGQRRATTGPIEASSWFAEATLGFMMTTAPTNASSLEVDECHYGSDWYATPHGSCGSGITRTRSLGWVYTSQQTDTLPLYRCVRTGASTHFLSNNSNCDNYGTSEYLMGYIPAH